MYPRLLLALALIAVLLAAACTGPVAVTAEEKPAAREAVSPDAGRDWPMYGGTPSRNMVNTVARGVPTEWGNKKGGKNVKWVADLGDRGYLPPAVAGGKVFICTNNHKPRDKEVKGDKAVLMCFKEDTGEFLWQITHDMPPEEVVTQAKPEGLLSTPTVEGDRLYYVTPAAEVVCASTDGKVLWTRDLMKDYKVIPHYVAFCSPLVVEDMVFVVTGNGRRGGESDKPVPEPKAPSFVALHKKDGKLAWLDNSPGEEIMEGAWASPAYAVVKGKGQVIFPGGDGWLYAFEPKEGKLIWKFDCNPKGSEFRIDSRGTRNYLLAPVVAGDRVYTTVGQQPDNGPGVGHVWCVDVTKTGDVSEELEKGKPNPNSGLVWHYGGPAPKGAARDYYFGRSISGCAVHDGLVYAAEYDGFLHCLDAKTGKHYWEEDLKAQVWASPLWVDGKVYVPGDDGNVWIFEQGKEKKAAGKVDMEDGIKAAPVVANGVLYVVTSKRLTGQLVCPLRRAFTDMTTTNTAAKAREQLDAQVRDVVRWHFSPETGTPFWLDRAKSFPFNPLKDVNGYDDLKLFGHFEDEWLRGGPVRRWVPKALQNKPIYVFETGGTTGIPKSRVVIDDFRIDYEMFSNTLPEKYFPRGGNWLMLGPSGPRRLRLAVEHMCQYRGGICFCVDLDPRWVVKVIKKGWMEHLKAYQEHVIDQAMTVLSANHEIKCMFTTPKLLDALCGRLEKEGTTLEKRGITGVFCGGTEMTSQWIRFAIEEFLGPNVYIAPTYGNTLMGLAAAEMPAAADGYKIAYYAPQPRAVVEVVDFDDYDKVVAYGKEGRVMLTTLTKEFFVPRFMERDEGVREKPSAKYAWDGVSGVKPFRAFAATTTVGVY